VIVDICNVSEAVYKTKSVIANVYGAIPTGMVATTGPKVIAQNCQKPS
jgi:hypothetical protein